MQQLRKVFIATAFCSLVAALGGAQWMLQETTVVQGKAAVQAPVFQVDPMWPKPLPNHWLIGSAIGVHSIATDSKGNIYTTETYEGKRVQRFLYKGLGPVPAASR